MTQTSAEAMLFATVAEALPCPVWVFDAGLRLAFANAAAWASAGVEPARLPPGTPLAETTRVFAHLGLLGTGDPLVLAAEHLRQDRSRPLRRLLRRADGTAQHLYSAPLPGGGFVSLLLDVTTLTVAGEEAEALARRLEDVLHRLHAGLAVYDTEQRLVLHNTNYERLLGLPRRMLPAGHSYADLLRELTRRGEFMHDDPAQLLADRAQIDRTRPHRHQRQRPNGQVLQFESQPVAEGGWLVEVTDITALKRAEDDASARAALMQGVLEALPLGVMVVGPDMRVRMFNAGCQDFFDGTGIKLGEHRADLARRRALAGLYGPGEVEALVAANLTPVGSGPSLRRRMRPDGRVIEVRAAPTPDGGYVQVMSDITALHQAQAEASSRAALMQLMLDSMRHGIALFGPDRRLITANALAAQLIGLPPDAMRPGITIEELRALQKAAHEFGDEAETAALIAISDQHDAHQPYRYTRRRPNGVILEIASDPTPGGGFVRTYIDITARAEAEVEARQQAATLQAMIDNLGLGVALFGADRRLVAANPLSAELGGLPAAHLARGTLLEDLVQAQVDRNAAGGSDAGARLAAEVLTQDRRLPHRHQRSTADGRVLEVRSDPMPDGGFVLSHLDITALSRAEAAAKQRADMFQAALDHMRHGIAMFGPDHRLIVANALAAQVSGLPAGVLQPGMTQEEVLRMHATAGFFDQDADQEAALQALVRADRREPRRNQRQLRDGRIIEVTSDPTPDGGFVITYGDITARARAEAAAAERARDLQVMQDHMRHGIAMYGPDRRLRTANALFRLLCGLPADTVLAGRPYAELVRAQREAGVFGSGAAALEAERDLLAHDRSKAFHHVRHGADGRILEFHSEPTEDGGFVVTISDITALATAEREAQQRAALQQAMLDNIQHGIALYGPDRRLRVANRLAGPAMGLPEMEAHRDSTLDELVQRQREAGNFGPEPEAGRLAIEVAAMDRSVPRRYQRHLPNGRIVEVASAPTPDGGFVITHSDITDLAQARAEAQQRASVLQAMLDNMRHGIVLFDSTQRVLSASALTAQLIGLPEGSLQPGATLDELAALQIAQGEFGTKGRPLIDQQERPDRREAFRYTRQRPNGTILEIASDPTPDGGFVVTYSDVTELSQAQAAAQQRAALLQAMLDNVQHGIGVYDASGRLVTANHLAAEFCGLTPEDMRPGMTQAELMRLQHARGAFGDGPAADAFLAETLARDWHSPSRFQRTDRQGRVLDITVNPMPDGGYVLGWSDITPLLELQAESTRRAHVLAVMMNNMRHGISLYDADHRLVAANALVAQMNGTAPGPSRTGWTLRQLLEEQQALGRLTEVQKQRQLALDRSRPHRVVATMPGGTVLEIRSDPTPDGGFVITHSDVTELNQARAEAQDRADMLQVMMDGMRHGIALFDREQRLLQFNALGAALAGLPGAPVPEGTTFADILARQVECGVVEPDYADATARLDRSKSVRYLREGPDGSTLEIGSDPTPDGGFVMTLTDVTPLARAEAESRHRAELLQLMLDNMHHGIVRYDSERRLVMANRLALDLHGLPPDTNLVGMREPDIVRLLVERGELTEALWQASLDADISRHRRLVRTRPNGMVVSFTATPTPDGGYVVTISDITELMAAENAARQRAAILQVMLDNIRHGICYYGPDRRVIAANRLAAHFGGHGTEANLVGRSLEELIDEQLANGAVPETMRPVAEQARQLDRSKPARHVRGSGEGRMLEVTSDPTPDGGFVVTSTDITRLVEAEAVAQSRAATLGVMLDNIRHGIVLFGADRRIVAANPRLREMLGIPDEAVLVGQHLHAYIRGLASIGVYGTDSEAVARAEATIDRFDPSRPNQHVRTGPQGQTIEVVSDPTPDGGFVLTYTDVTEDRRVRAELEAAGKAAEAANLAKSRFLATMSHELRTPLNAVIGFSEALQTAPDPERSREYLGAIHEAGRHLLSLIDDILDVTRAETTGFQVSDGEVDLQPVCEGVVRVMRAAAASGQVKLGLALAPNLPMVRADEVRLRQVLLNLVSNAVKFTPAEGRVTLLAATEADGALVIRVRDTGIGVKPEDMPRAFQPFSQLDSSLSRRFPGSGLGLYLSRALAEAQGAQLTLESDPGEGTTAVLRFPPERLLPARPDATPPPMFAP